MLISYKPHDKLYVLCPVTIYMWVRSGKIQLMQQVCSLEYFSDFICCWWYGTPSYYSGLDRCKLNERLHKSSLFVFALLFKCGIWSCRDQELISCQIKYLKCQQHMKTKQKEASQEKMESTKDIHKCKHIALGFLC